jgi:hypothetical protein
MMGEVVVLVLALVPVLALDLVLGLMLVELV